MSKFSEHTYFENVKAGAVKIDMDRFRAFYPISLEFNPPIRETLTELAKPMEEEEYAEIGKQLIASFCESWLARVKKNEQEGNNYGMGINS